MYARSTSATLTRLRDAPARSLQYVAVENFRDVPQAAIRKMMLKWHEPFGSLAPSGLAAFVYPYIST